METDATVRFFAVVPAAGAGARMGAPVPKQYLRLGGRTVLEHTLARLCAQPQLRGVALALAADDRHWDALRYECPLPLWRVDGGAERCHSVLNALERLAQEAAPHDWVLVHDAARPCVRGSDIDRLIETARRHPVGGLLAVPVRDTMKRADEHATVLETVSRDGLWHALTPQMFRIGELTQAVRSALAEGCLVTDEAAAMERAGRAPRLVPGHSDNIKITRPEDLALAGFFLQQQHTP